jgi:hypothetical protein
MGSSTMLDFISSLIIGGFLLFMVMRLDAQSREASSVDMMNLMVQENITALVDMLETDFRRMGYSANPDDPRLLNPTDCIRYADSSSLKFYTDILNDGVLDSVYYYVGPTSELASTENPNDRYLYRKVNTETPIKMNLGVTQFRFKFFDALGAPINQPVVALPQTIYSMELTVSCESPQRYKQEFNPDTSAFFMMWRQLRLASKNLRNR